MRVNKFFLPLFGVVPMVAMVLIAQLTGNWSTSGRATVDMASMKPEDIKGWMTWQEVSEGFGIPLDELYALSGVPKDIPPTTAMKDMEGLLEGFETTTVREVVTAYLAGEAQPAEPPASEASAGCRAYTWRCADRRACAGSHRGDARRRGRYAGPTGRNAGACAYG